MTIPKLVLDPRDPEELVNQSYERIRVASDNTITNFDPSSPVAALVEGQVYATSELLWYLNKLPEALAIEVMRLAGVQRSPGTKARGSLTIVLNNPLATTFFIPRGYLFPHLDGGYVTLEDLLIQAGDVSSEVEVEASRVGSDFNLAELAYNPSNTGFSLVSAVFNLEPINGGTNLEPISRTLERSQVAIRTRDALISIADYESKAEELAGVGSKAWCIPLLSADRVTEAPGNCHVFILGADKEILSGLSTIQQGLQALTFVGAYVWVSSPTLEEIKLRVTVNVEAITQEQAQLIVVNLEEYLNQYNYVLGSTLLVKELEYVVRSTTGVTSVDSVMINGLSINKKMGNFSLPLLTDMEISLKSNTDVQLFRSDPDTTDLVIELGTNIGDPD